MAWHDFTDLLAFGNALVPNPLASDQQSLLVGCEIKDSLFRAEAVDGFLLNPRFVSEKETTQFSFPANGT